MTTPAQMWAEFSHSTGVVANYEAFGFGSPETPKLRDELARLVEEGTKIATTGHPAEFAAEGEKMPEVGDYWVVIDSQGEARAVIRTIEVERTRFADVDERFARDEGEGDRSLEWWRRVHLDYYQKAGLPVDDDTVLVLERFEKVWPATGD